MDNWTWRRRRRSWTWSGRRRRRWSRTGKRDNLKCSARSWFSWKERKWNRRESTNLSTDHRPTSQEEEGPTSSDHVDYCPWEAFLNVILLAIIKVSDLFNWWWYQLQTFNCQKSKAFDGYILIELLPPLAHFHTIADDDGKGEFYFIKSR